MDKRLYRFLKWTAILFTLAWVGWSFYDSMISPRNPGDMAYLEANKLFEDGAYQRALDKYGEALNADPDHIHAMRGRARSLMQLGRVEQALAAFDAAISLEPDFGATYANRGILRDRLGRYEKAVEDYTRALAAFDAAISREPDFGATYANRGILRDRLGRYEKAVEDYTRALELDAELADGPHWLTRFLRNQPQKPPGIAERAAYLREQLAKPANERVLLVNVLELWG